jgi:radical SAM superfamily enzyme YgiQ (UPF0313 family)
MLTSGYRTGPVVLVSRDIAFTFPLSYAYLAGYLRQHGEDVRVLFKPSPLFKSSRPAGLERLAKQILSLNPVLVGFGNLYPELKETGELIRMLDKAGRKFPVVIGGQMVSPIPEFAVRITGADFGVIGEGEIILFELVRALREGTDPHGVGGLAVREGDAVALTGPGKFIEDLSKIPPIPYDLFPEQKWLPIGEWYAAHMPNPDWRIPDRVVNIHGGRGCPYNCNFCYHNSTFRLRPMSDMMAEAAELVERFKANVLYFSDDLVTCSPKRARELVDGVRSLKKPLEYSVSTRFDILDRMDDGLLQEMKDTGCRIMGPGIESGSDRILKVMDKKIDRALILKGLDRLRRVGILPTGSIMVGQYSETKEDVEMSISLVQESVRSDPNIQYAFCLCTPFPGSRLHDQVFEEGRLRDEKEFYDLYFHNQSNAAAFHSGDFNQVVNMSAMSAQEVQEMFAKISRAYAEAKRKHSHVRAAIPVERLEQCLGLVNWYMLPRPLKNSAPYRWIQGKLDATRLRLRGIDKLGTPASVAGGA